MTDPNNPMGREYSPTEIAAAKRVGVANMQTNVTRDGKVLSGPIIWATGPWHPDHARQQAKDWALVSAAIDREWKKPTGGGRQ